jgi:hypothetical protein
MELAKKTTKIREREENEEGRRRECAGLFCQGFILRRDNGIVIGRGGSRNEERKEKAGEKEKRRPNGCGAAGRGRAAPDCRRMAWACSRSRKPSGRARGVQTP